MRLCPRCQAHNPDTAQFCDQCGASFTVARAINSVVDDYEDDGVVTITMPQYCSRCGNPIIMGEAFCDACGASLLHHFNSIANNVPTPPPIPSQQHYPPPQPITATPSQVAPGGYPATGNTIAVHAPAPPASVSTLAPARLVIQPSGTTMPLPNVTHALVGRSDPVSQFHPDVDLAPYNGQKQGVGRRHIRLVVRKNQIHVEDMNSTNGTFLNKLRIAPHKLHPLNDGDELRLGRLVLNIYLS